MPVDHPTIDYRERLWDRASEIATAPLEIFPGKKFSIDDLTGSSLNGSAALSHASCTLASVLCVKSAPA
jgi:hypothetical protein